MAPHIRLITPSLHGSDILHGLPRIRIVKHAHLYLEQEES